MLYAICFISLRFVILSSFLTQFFIWRNLFPKSKPSVYYMQQIVIKKINKIKNRTLNGFTLVYSSATKCTGGSVFTHSTEIDIIALMWETAN